MGDDAALMEFVTSASLACGFHAGDPDTIAQTLKQAKQHGVGVGAHPGFADLSGFGRNRMHLSEETVANLVAYQVAALQGMAFAQGLKLSHLKLHGALANMAADSAKLALICYEAARAVVPGIALMVMAGSQQQKAAQQLGGAVVCEVFADRAYEENGSLVDRREPGAIIHAPQEAAQRVVKMVQAGAIVTKSGQHLPTQIDTVCLHGDTPAAIEMAAAVRQALQHAGIHVRPF